MHKRKLVWWGTIGLFSILVVLAVACQGPEEDETVNGGAIAQPAGWEGGYLGEETCAVCHSGDFMPDVASMWQQTGHSTMFENIFDRYTENTPYCIACHTVGYDEEIDNGGFDDMARAAGWDPEQENIGSWVQSMGLEGVKESVAGRLINIQCENCHGVGMHQETVSWEAENCMTCHEGGHQGEAYENSKHYTGELVGSADLHTAESSSCAPCHTGQGFVLATIRGEELVYPGDEEAEGPVNMLAPEEQPPIICQACHDPHDATNPHQLRMAPVAVEIPAGVMVDADISATCVACHANKRDVEYKAAFLAGEKSRGVHHNTMSDIFFGVGASDYDGALTFTNSVHTTLVEEGCVQCHMAGSPLDNPGEDGEVGTHDDVVVSAVGDHSFAMSGMWNFTTHEADEEAGELVENVGACMIEGCHAESSITTFNRIAYSDYDGDGTIEGVQDEVQGLLDLLAEQLPQDDEGNVLSSSYSEDTVADAEWPALWNYFLVANDGSLGIHNTAYAVQLLQKTYKQLTGEDVPGATLR